MRHASFYWILVLDLFDVTSNLAATETRSSVKTVWITFNNAASHLQLSLKIRTMCQIDVSSTIFSHPDSFLLPSSSSSHCRVVTLPQRVVASCSSPFCLRLFPREITWAASGLCAGLRLQRRRSVKFLFMWVTLLQADPVVGEEAFCLHTVLIVNLQLLHLQMFLIRMLRNWLYVKYKVETEFRRMWTIFCS